MPSLQEALNVDKSGYVPVEKQYTPPYIPHEKSNQPTYNAMLRCPLPPIAATSDTLRQFYMPGIAQTRLLTPPVINTGGGSTSSSTAVVSTSSSSSSTTVATIAAKTVTITSPALLPAQVFQTSVLMSKSFQLLSITSDNPACVRIYGTATAQSTDATRAVDGTIGAGIGQNIITDVVMDTSPYSWGWENRVGSNNMSPQTSTIYVSIINPTGSSETITTTITFVPIENT